MLQGFLYIFDFINYEKRKPYMFLFFMTKSMEYNLASTQPVKYVSDQVNLTRLKHEMLYTKVVILYHGCQTRHIMSPSCDVS